MPAAPEIKGASDRYYMKMLTFLLKGNTIIKAVREK